MTATDPFNPFGGNPLRDREDVAQAMWALFAPLRPCFSPGGARVVVGTAGAVFDSAAAEMEGFARPLWGLAAATAGGDRSVDWALFRRGLVNGTDPAHPEYWGDVGAVDQRMVELAAIGFALRVARADLWDPLSPAERGAVAAYLLAARALPFSDNNWKFFRLMIDLGLAAVGIAVTPEPHDAYLDEIDGFYLGEGWYRDGATRQIDHYNPFGFHLYGLLYAALATDREDRRATFVARARSIAPQVAHWFADDGAALPYGRSLTYRFAAAAFWGALAFAGVEALPWGVVKGHCLRHLRWWSGRPIATRDGLLTIGHGYPQPAAAENYNSPQSPYWAFKAFLPLALPADHPFWQAEERAAPMPDAPVTLPMCGMVVRHAPGNTVALVSGPGNTAVRHAPEKYAKFAYSTRDAFSIESDWRRPDQGVFDNMLALIDEAGDVRVRTACEAARVGDGVLWSQWSGWPDVSVESWLWWDGAWQMRVHRIRAGRRIRTIEGGFAIPVGGRTIPADARPGIAAATAQAFSGIVDLSSPPRGARLLTCEPNTNLIAPRTVVPQLIGPMTGVGETLLACAILSDAGGAGWARPPAPPSQDDLDRWRDGAAGLAIMTDHPAATGRGRGT